MAQLRLARLIRPSAGPSLKYTRLPGLARVPPRSHFVGWKACPVATPGPWFNGLAVVLQWSSHFHATGCYSPATSGYAKACNFITQAFASRLPPRYWPMNTWSLIKVLRTSLASAGSSLPGLTRPPPLGAPRRAIGSSGLSPREDPCPDIAT